MNERKIFIEALEKSDPAEQQAFLRQSCGSDDLLRGRIEALVKAHQAAGEFLEQPPAGLAATIAATTRDRDGHVDEIPPNVLDPSEKPGCLGTIGIYEVVELVGRGGMGVVFRAYDPKLNRIVAIKVMLPELAANPMAVKRFLREAQAAAAISHDYVVRIHQIDEVNRPPFIVMEFITGRSLQQRIERTGSLNLKEILRIGMQMAAGLAAAHAQGLVHRDVKPANVLLENDIERVKLTDFGVARATDDVAITMTGQITGTPGFMSPEQACGQPVDHRSDLFSLGSVIYTMCTGRHPFRAEMAVATLRRVCDDTPRPIHEVNGELPPWLSVIVDRLLAKRPADRYQTSQEVADVLEQCLAHVQQPSTIPLPLELASGFSPRVVAGFDDQTLIPIKLQRSFSSVMPWAFGFFVVAVMFGWIIVMIATRPTFRLGGMHGSQWAEFTVIAMVLGFAMTMVAVPLAFWIRRAIVEWRYAQRTGDWAPGWIIRCLSCGKSKPLSQLGWTRLGAYGRQTRWVACSTCGKASVAEMIRASDPAFEELAVKQKLPPQLPETDDPWLLRIPWAAWIGLLPFLIVYSVAIAELQQEIDPALARLIGRAALMIGTAYLLLYGMIAAMIRFMRVSPVATSAEPKGWRIVMFFALLWFFTTLFAVNWAG